MEQSRKEFFKKSVLGLGVITAACESAAKGSQQIQKPLVISTWDHGKLANEVSWKMLKEGKSSLDAVEAGVMIVESDPEARTVGLGGYPDRDGFVTLDASIMDHDSRCGSVAFLQHIENPIAVARKVMEETPHVMLVGEGALQFALEQGFERINLLTEKSKKDWEKWLEKSKYEPVINIENHDTIGMLAIDNDGRISGSCTTSGASYKMHGRVGDSPIIGAGLFIDGEVGGAVATGLGEEMIRTASAAMIVEQMRHGADPQEACDEIVDRIIRKNGGKDVPQAAFIAVNKYGNYGGGSVHKGFTYAICTDKIDNTIEKAKFKLTS